MSSKSKQQQQQKEFRNFRQWVLSLSREELLDAMAFTFHGQEYDMLLDMVKLQPPPPIPVHPRAVGYKSRSQKGARLDYWYREEECLRWRQPRLFQLERVQENDSFENDFGGRRNSSAQARLARLRRQKQMAQQQKQQRYYQVIARKKIGPWGEHYSLGCTWQQQDADDKVIRGTRLGRKKISQSDGRVNEEKTAWFVDLEDSSSNDLSVGAILGMLRIVTRGHFLQGPLQAGKGAYYAPWLKPSERWFSLSMYLGSRYEVALYESYVHHRDHRHLLGSMIRNAMPGNVSPVALQTNLLSSICLALQETLRNEQEKPAIDYIRDGVIWALVEQTDCSFIDSQIAAMNAFETPLVQAHLPVYAHFQLLVRTKLEELLTKDAERSVLIENGASVNGILGHNGSTHSKHRKKRNKKKKRNSNGKRFHGMRSLPVIPADSEEDMENGEDQVEIQTSTPVALEFPDNDTLPYDRNRNIITVLEIMESVMEDVFVQVGLPRTPSFGDERDKKKTLSRASSKTIQIKWKKKTPPKPTQPADAQKVVKNDKTVNVSNIPASTNHAVSFESRSRPTGVIARPMSFDLEATEQYQNPVPHAPWGVPFSMPGQQLSNQQQERNTSYYPTDAASMFSGPNSLHGADFHDPFAIGRSLMLGAMSSESDGNWAFVNRYQSRDESILSEFFPHQYGDNEDDEDELLMTASTAASIASSIVETEGLEDDEVVPRESAPSVSESSIQETNEEKAEAIEYSTKSPTDESSPVSKIEDASLKTESDHVDTAELPAESEAAQITTLECRSPSPEAPSTPPPTLSPILLSLADLKDLREGPGSTASQERDDSTDPNVTTKLPSLPGHGSLPSSPVLPPKNGLTSSWSRDDLRIQAFRDDQRIKQTSRGTPPTPQPPRAAESPSYKAMAAKSLAKPSVDFRVHVVEASLRRQDATRESCAHSETALEGQREDQQSWAQEDTENHSFARDETTTITSGVSQRAESEELATLREERNQFRDMFLSLGAEVAKLKAMLAAQQAAIPTPMEFHDAYSQPMMHMPASFDMKPFFHVGHGMRPGPMSDAGFQRGDHESQVSEDEVTKARVDTVQRMSSSHTVAGSDASIDFNNSNPTLSGNQQTGTMPLYDSVHSHGLQSRLTKDIFQFLSATNLQLKKLDGKRKLAVERFSRLTKTIWPRAQVKLYGSYVSGLCLPTSDLDIVVCLPAVHKKDVALAPGVLEGRNAINETSQKLLARELKGESWLDVRSIKLIERTIVPVIKVCECKVDVLTTISRTSLKLLLMLLLLQQLPRTAGHA